MEVFVEFKNQQDKTAVLAFTRDYCRITACVPEKNQYWFKPHDDTCYNAFTDWLEQAGIEYENV